MNWRNIWLKKIKVVVHSLPVADKNYLANGFSMNKGLVLTALKRGIRLQPPRKGLIHHFDRGIYMHHMAVGRKFQLLYYVFYL